MGIQPIHRIQYNVGSNIDTILKCLIRQWFLAKSQAQGTLIFCSRQWIRLKADTQESGSEVYYPDKVKPDSSEGLHDVGLMLPFLPQGTAMPINQEARAGRRVSHIIIHSLGRAVTENIRFSASVLALNAVGPMLPALNRTHVFICTATPLMYIITLRVGCIPTQSLPIL